MTIARDDFERFRTHQRTVYRGVWFGLIAAAVAGCVALVLAWSYLAGLVWAIALPVFGYDAIKRWNRRRWLRRFPEVAASDFKWVPDPDGPKTGGP